MRSAIPPAPGVRQREKMRAIVKPFLVGALFLLASNPVFFSYARDHTPFQPDGRPPSCQTTIRYRMGTLDPRFGITSEEFRRAVEEASDVWASDRKRFKYDPRARLRINLVYDTRQELTLHANTVRAGISAKMKQADLIEDRILPLKENFRSLDASYSDQLAVYNRDQDSYNRDVKHWNGIGGAPEGEFQILSNQKQSLRKQQALLEAKRQALNRLTDELNELIKKRNALLILANTEAGAFNNSGSAGIQFEQGRYVREGGEERIDVFQFESKDGLLVILAHELGHALGMKHNANPSSIMSPLIHTDRLALTAEDEDGLRSVCALH
jgi:hypothetical protein